MVWVPVGWAAKPLLARHTHCAPKDAKLAQNRGEKLPFVGRFSQVWRTNQLGMGYS